MGILGFSNESAPFQKIFYLADAGTGTGQHQDSPLDMAADADLWSIPAGCLISKVYLIITTGITGTTNLDFGDDDNADGFFDSSLSVADLSVAGLYGWDAKVAGAYLRVETAGGTDALDLYVVPAAKYYSAAGKELKMDLTTASTAGAVRLVVEGYQFIY
jgi:hypothetical protein